MNPWLLLYFAPLALLILVAEFPRIQCARRGHKPGFPYTEGGRRWFDCRRCHRTYPHDLKPKAPMPRLTQHEIDGNTGAIVRHKAYNEYLADLANGVDGQSAAVEEKRWPEGRVIENVSRGGLR